MKQDSPSHSRRESFMWIAFAIPILIALGFIGFALFSSKRVTLEQDFIFYLGQSYEFNRYYEVDREGKITERLPEIGIYQDGLGYGSTQKQDIDINMYRFPSSELRERLRYYDASKDTARAITQDELDTVRINRGSVAKDGTVVRYDYSRSSSRSLFGSSTTSSSPGWYAIRDRARVKLNMTDANGNQLDSGSLDVIGWVK